jgi:hypothetical protein
MLDNKILMARATPNDDGWQALWPVSPGILKKQALAQA